MKREYRFFVYMMSSKSRVIYTGMTNDLVDRVREHKMLKVNGFTKKYKVTRLIYFETLKYSYSCIDREKQVKAWTRAKRVALIESVNPTTKIWGSKAGPSLRSG